MLLFDSGQSRERILLDILSLIIQTVDGQRKVAVDVKTDTGNLLIIMIRKSETIETNKKKRDRPSRMIVIIRAESAEVDLGVLGLGLPATVDDPSSVEVDMAVDL